MYVYYSLTHFLQLLRTEGTVAGKAQITNLSGTDPGLLAGVGVAIASCYFQSS
jgi:hypothetical protein